MTTARSLLAGSCLLLAFVFSSAPPTRAQQKRTPSTPCCLSALRITAQPSIELLVTAPDGFETGYDPVTDQDLNQIPSSGYYRVSISGGSGGSANRPEVRKVRIGMPAAGRYTVQAISRSPGSFTLEFAAFDSKGKLTIRKFSGAASRATTFVYDVRFSPSPGAPFSVIRLAPLSGLAADVVVDAGPPPSFQVNATFSLGSASGGFDPLTQPVSFYLASYSVTIPPGSFKRSGEGNYAFDGTIAGVTLHVRIVSLADGNWRFQAKAQGIDMTAAINPLRLLLLLGENAGAKLVNAVSR